jgi:quercetin dioxygenase-like cupin family protein
VVQGEMWLGERGGPARRLVPGDRFHLAADVPHDERYGAEGATYWVARRAR